MNYLNLVFKALGYHCFDLENILKSEAIRYANEYYLKASNSDTPGVMRDYGSWLSKIMYFQKKVPQATFFPKDMYQDIIQRIGLISKPVSNNRFEGFLSTMKPKVQEHVDGILKMLSFSGTFHYCYQENVEKHNFFRSQKLRTAACLYEIPQGYLLLHSWGTVRNYDYTDFQSVENQILNAKLRGIYLPVIINQ